MYRALILASWGALLGGCAVYDAPRYAYPVTVEPVRYYSLPYQRWPAPVIYVPGPRYYDYRAPPPPRFLPPPPRWGPGYWLPGPGYGPGAPAFRPPPRPWVRCMPMR